VSAGAAVNFQNIPTGINHLEIYFDFTMGTNSNSLQMQFYNSSGVLDSGGSSYYFSFFTLSSGALAATPTTTSSVIVIGNLLSNSSTIGISGSIIIPNIQGVKDTQCNYNANWLDQGGAIVVGGWGFGGRNVNGNITGVKFTANTGTVSGRATLVGRA
jgi:hypothetical protein